LFVHVTRAMAPETAAAFPAIVVRGKFARAALIAVGEVISIVGAPAGAAMTVVVAMAMLFSSVGSGAKLLIVASVCSVAGPAAARATIVSDSVVDAASDARVHTTTPTACSQVQPGTLGSTVSNVRPVASVTTTLTGGVASAPAFVASTR
jgi:hypothetical protein